jgi:activator of 2-hydroxyglutaryl-CoA dehydratase
MYSAGVDVGAASGEALIWDGKEIVSYSIVPTGFNSRRAAYRAMEQALKGTNISQEDIGGT